MAKLIAIFWCGLEHFVTRGYFNCQNKNGINETRNYQDVFEWVYKTARNTYNEMPDRPNIMIAFLVSMQIMHVEK